MALEMFTGFEFATLGMENGYLPFWSNENFGVVGSAARTGQWGARGYSAGYLNYKHNMANEATRVVGMAMRFSAITGTSNFLSFHDGLSDAFNNTTCQVGFGVDGAGRITAYRGRGGGSTGSGTLLGTTTWAFSINTWYYIEFVVTVHNSAGVVEVWVDDTQVLNLTGIDTQNTANAYSNAFLIIGSNAGTTDIDDLYCLSGSGAAPTARLGECTVRPVIPSTGNGSNTGSTPSTGTDRGAMVDEGTMSQTDYNAFSAPAKDTYNYPAAGTTGTIIGVNVASLCAKTGPGTCTARNLVRIGSTDYPGTTRPISMTTQLANDLFVLSPATGVAFTEAEINAAEFGVERVA